jgi:hypothetical protein
MADRLYRRLEESGVTRFDSILRVSGVVLVARLMMMML